MWTVISGVSLVHGCKHRAKLWALRDGLHWYKTGCCAQMSATPIRGVGIVLHFSVSTCISICSSTQTCRSSWSMMHIYAYVYNSDPCSNADVLSTCYAVVLFMLVWLCSLGTLHVACTHIYHRKWFAEQHFCQLDFSYSHVQMWAKKSASWLITLARTGSSSWGPWGFKSPSWRCVWSPSLATSGNRCTWLLLNGCLLYTSDAADER